MTKPILIPGLELRSAILAGAASTAELEAMGADPSEVFAIKADRTSTHLRAISKESKAVEGEPRVRRWVFSDERVDRHGDVILAKGWNVDDFAAAEGPILWGHNHNAPPIGKSKRPVRKTVDGVRSLVGDVTLAEDEVNPHAGLLWRLVEAGFLKTGSVGFAPTAARYGDDLTETERAKYGLGKWGVLYEGQELLEFSLVSVPANPGARTIERGLKMLTETGAATDRDIDELVKTYPLTAEQAKERVRESVKGFFLFSDEAMTALKSLSEAEEERDDDQEATEERSAPEEPESASPTAEERLEALEERGVDLEEVRSIVAQARAEAADNPLPDGQPSADPAKAVLDVAAPLKALTEALAGLVDAVTLNTETSTETAKAARQLVDSATTILERSNELTGEARAGGAPSKERGEGGASEDEAVDPDGAALAQLAEAVKALSAKNSASNS